MILFNQFDRLQQYKYMSDLPKFYKNMWQVGEPNFIKRIDGQVPQHQFELIRVIKDVGMQAIGPKIISAAEFDWTGRRGEGIFLDDILLEHPALAKAIQDTRLTCKTIIDGFANIHYNGDGSGFTDLGFLLPDHIIYHDSRIPIHDRIAIRRLELREISFGEHEIAPIVKNNRSLWYNLSLYYGINPTIAKGVSNENDFLKLMADRGVLVPLGYGRRAFNSWIKDPTIKTKNGEFDAGGKIDIQCTALFESPTSEKFLHV